MKKDVNFSEAIYDNWKEKIENSDIKGISKKSSDLIKRYIFDMELGQNISKKSKKGGRSKKRLVVLKQLIIQIAMFFEQRKISDISKVTEKDAHRLFSDIYNGIIKRQDGKNYLYPVQFVSIFKAFWHWWIKVNRKENKNIFDITEDLELRKPAVNFVYLEKEQLEKMLPYFTKDEQLLCLFLFDSLIRFPTECLSLQVKDIYEREGEVWVNIPDEISKTFGRNFNLLFCGEALLKHIKDKKLNQDDFLFPLKRWEIAYFNKKLKKVAVQVLGDKVSHPKARGKFSEISGYDFRHSGAIHLRILAQKNNSISLDAIRQRGGWSDFEMLNYYTQLIGLSGEIKKESLLIEEDRTKLEKEMEIVKKKMKVLADYTQLAFMKNYTKKELKQMREQVYDIEKDQFEEKLLEEGK